MGIPTIGIGFNLKKSGAQEEIEGVGADYAQVLSGAQCLDDDQITELFDEDMNSAVNCVSNWIEDYSSLDDGPASAVADMAFNLGCGGVMEFKEMKAAIENSDWSGAAAAMQNSLWCSQVGNRCNRDVSCMEEGKR